MIINYYRKRKNGTLVSLLIILSFIFAPSLLFSNYNFNSKPFDEEQSLNLSTNYLFKGTTYTFNLDDFYDDTNLYKIYTGAKFQTEAFNQTLLEWSGTVNNDTVTPVDNDETQYGESSGVYNGTYDFREYADGTEGLDIDFIDSIQAGGAAEIIAEYAGHKKVLKLTSTAATGIWHYFDRGIISGIIEMFIKGVTGNGYMRLRDHDGFAIIDLRFMDSGDITIKYGNGIGGYQWTTPYSTTTAFPHVKIEFDCITDLVSIWIEGTNVINGGTFINDYDADHIDRLRWYFNIVGTEYYVDAVGIKTDDYLATESFDYTTEEGVYYGTYDFRDEIGETNLDIDFVDIITGTAEIISDYEGHKGVLNFTHDASNMIINNLPVYQATGTIEFYLKEVLSRTYFRIQDIGDLLLFEIMIYPTYVKVYYGDGAGGNVYSANYFFTTDFPHFKVSFDCTTDTFSVWCEDFLIVEDVNFKDNEDLTEVYRVRTYNSAGSDFYLDAAGYSWDTTSHSGLGYTVGWNVNPCDLEPLLENYFDTLGLVYNTSVCVNPYVDGHGNVLEIYDNNPDGAMSFYNYYDTMQTDSTVEFWWRYDGTLTYQHYLNMVFREGGTERVRVIFGYTGIGQIMSHNGSQYISIVTDLPINTFYHIKIVFDDSVNTFDFYVDEVDKGTFDYFSNSVVGIDRVYMVTRTTGDNYHHWLDALGVVGVNGYEEGDNLEGWDKDYTIGENLYPDNINMINGSYDYTDNMKVNDDSSTNFTSTHTDGYIYETPSQWDNFTFTEGSAGEIGEIETIDADYSTIISTEAVEVPNEYIDDVTYNQGGDGGGTLENTHDDDSAYFRMNSELLFGMHAITAIFVFDPALAGRDFLISAHIDCSSSVNTMWLLVNDVMWKSGQHIDFDNQPHNDVTSIKYYTDSETTSHYSLIYYFKIVENISPTPAELDVQVDFGVDDVDLSSIEFLKFSHKTNISVDVDLDIWNWDTSTWYEIESITNFATFDDDSFTLGVDSDYVNSSFGVRMRFQATTSADFELQIDRLRLDYLTVPIAELEFTITFTFANYNEDLLAMTIQSWQKTNISQTINFSIWNYDTESYTQISSSSDTSFAEKEYNTTSPSNFISPTGTVKLYWVGSNTTNDFELHIDYLFGQIFYKLDLVHEKSFDTNGIYRYRWEITGSIHYTQWVIFEVVDPEDNFHAISESDNPTRWILQNATLTPVEDFHDDINTNYWNLVDVSNVDFDYSTITTGDAWVWTLNPNDNYGTYAYIYTGYTSIDEVVIRSYLSFSGINSSYLFSNQSGENRIIIKTRTAMMGTNNINLSSTSSFIESIITWNNAPNGISSQDIVAVSVPETMYYWNISDLTGYYMIQDTVESGVGHYVEFYSKEGSSIKPLFMRHDINKNYFGSGYMYMQTDETELISLKSTDYGTYYNLSSGDYFEVDFQTSSDSLINLVLLRDGVVNKTLTLSQSGNPNFNRHTAEVSVDEDVEFDQLKISSTFEDEDYVKVYDIKTYKYEIVGDSANFIVGSHQDYETYLTPDLYNLRIYDPDDGDVKINTNITIDSGYNSYLYEPTETIQCRLTLFSLTEEYLQFEDYHINISRSLDGEYGDFWLVDTSFYADIGTEVYIEVYDKFDALIHDDSELAKAYIDLYIKVYSLKIRNEATEIVNYTLQNIDIGSSKFGLLFSDEIVEYHVTNGSYRLYYINYEDNYPREYNFELTTHKTISINSTYHTVYIGLFTYDGLGLNRDWVRFYINGNRSDFGRNIIQFETAELIVKDYFNNTLANDTIDASAYSEYNIYVQVYSLYLLNQFTYDDLIMNITQVGSGTWLNQLIPASSALRYRFIPNVNYTINATYINGTVYSIRTVNLTDNSQTESFGVPSKPEEYPKDVYFGVYTTTGLGINHDLLRFYIDDVRSDFGFNRIEDMIVLLTVKDYFNTTLFNQNVNTSGIYEYNMLITLYSLQIKNLQIQETTVDINSTLYIGTLLSEESLYFMLAENYYNISYYDTNDVYKSFLIYLDSNQAYELNRSQVCFLIYADQQGNHLVFENYKTYLNGSRTYINNFYREIGDIVGIEIKDRYNISIKNDTLTVVSGVNEKYIVLTIYSLKIMSQQLCFNHINITRDPAYYESDMYWSTWIAPSEIIEFKLFAGYYKINLTDNENEGFSFYSYTLSGDDILLIGSNNTLENVLINIANVNTTIGNQITNVEINITNQNSEINNTIVNIVINLDNINSTLGTLLLDIDTAISNINSSIISEIVSLGTEISNINSSITSEILNIGVDIANVNSSVISQLLTLGVNISNINGSIVNQIIDLGVDITNINTSLSNQILSIGVDISNLDTSITNQFVSTVNVIENVNASIIDQTLVILADITNINSTLLNQMVVLGVDITNINASITNQILDLSVDLTNINSSISNLLTNINISISNLENDIGTFYAFTNTSFINLNNVMNTSFINIETTIYSINQTISNLVIGVSNDIYLINGTISTMITQLETNLLLMNVSIDTALFDLDTTLDLIGSNITSNYILLNNSIYLNSLNINDSRIAIINNLLLVNNTISTLIADVYSAIYLINNSIYTAVVDLGTYLNIINNTISGNLSIVLEMNDFLTELYVMTMFSELLNWTNIGLNITLLISQIDSWTFVNNYINQSIEVHLRYQGLIEELIISADDSIEQYLPNEDVWYRLWSVEDQEYIDEWEELDPDNKTVNFGFFEADLPPDPEDYIKDYMVIFVIFTLAMVALIIIIVFVKKAKKIGEQPSKKKEKEEAKVYKKSYAFNRQIDLSSE